MLDKVCLVTGGTSGIGLETVRGLAGKGATVIAVGRNPQKGAHAVSEDQRTTGNDSVQFVSADLSEQAGVRALVQEIETRCDRIHVLVNNAGGFFMRRQTSADGIEMTLALNYLSPFLLTGLLLNRLEAGAPARVVNVSSFMYKTVRIDFDDLEGRKRYFGPRAYGRSKLALMLSSFQLAKRLETKRVTVNVCDPGLSATGIIQKHPWYLRLVRPIVNLAATTPEVGARTSIYLASSPEVKECTGMFFVRAKPATPSAAATDPGVARRLWDVTLELTGMDSL
ncbi:SDR family oxidoreductase [Chloroflexota bacterium]